MFVNKTPRERERESHKCARTRTPARTHTSTSITGYSDQRFDNSFIHSLGSRESEMRRAPSDDGNARRGRSDGSGGGGGAPQNVNRHLITIHGQYTGTHRGAPRSFFFLQIIDHAFVPNYMNVCKQDSLELRRILRSSARACVRERACASSQCGARLRRPTCRALFCSVSHAISPTIME